jgi:hypothetical protein
MASQVHASLRCGGQFRWSWLLGSVARPVAAPRSGTPSPPPFCHLHYSSLNGSSSKAGVCSALRYLSSGISISLPSGKSTMALSWTAHPSLMRAIPFAILFSPCFTPTKCGLDAEDVTCGTAQQFQAEPCPSHSAETRLLPTDEDSVRQWPLEACRLAPRCSQPRRPVDGTSKVHRHGCCQTNANQSPLPYPNH